MIQDIYISHIVGHCAVCGFPILDTGYNDDMDHDFVYENIHAGNPDADWFFNTFHNM